MLYQFGIFSTNFYAGKVRYTVSFKAWPVWSISFIFLSVTLKDIQNLGLVTRCLFFELLKLY